MIYQNPFRVLGLPVTATDREIAKRIGDLSIYADMGKTIEYDFDHFFHVKPFRSIESIIEAKQKIDQPGNKLFYALFWFWENSNNTIDEMAFEELKKGNVEKATTFWERETQRGITYQNKSNHKNLSTLRLGLSTQNGKLNKDNFISSLSLSGLFLSNGHFVEFTNQVLGIKHSVDLTEILSHYVYEIISMANPHISLRTSENKVTHKELLHYFETYPDAIQNDILGKFIGKPIHNIERQIEKSEQQRTADESIANKAGLELYNNTKADIDQLLSVLSKTDIKFQLIADKLADELISCSVAYFNKYRDTDIDPGDDALKLTEHAKLIVVGDKIKDRINQGLPIIREYVDGKPKRGKLKPVKQYFDFIYTKLVELQSETQNKTVDFRRKEDGYLISFLPSNAKRFVDSCEPKLVSIKNHLGSKDEDFLELCDIVVGATLGVCIEYLNDVAKLAGRLNSYDDDKKRSMFISAISEIKPVFDKIDKLDMSHSKRSEYTEFCYKIGIKKKESTDGGCYVATMVYGSYNAPEVRVLRKFRDEYLLQNTLGRLFVILYYRFSPSFVERTKHITLVHTIFRSVLNRVVKIIKASR